MVKPIQDGISLNVTNNTTFRQNVNMLGGSADPLGIPPHNLYEWDLSGETFYGTTTVTIVVSTTANPTPVTYSVDVVGANVQSVAFALNSLNVGNFLVSGNIIYVSNDFYIYGNLTINSIAFNSTWNTANTSFGSSASNQIQLPLFNGGTYNFTVYWGDGTSDVITSWNQAETLHTYATAGTYNIGIVGTIIEWNFDIAAINDCEKILSISSWGTLQFSTLVTNSFRNCINLDLSGVTDVPNLSSSNDLSNCFDGCTSLTTINRSNEWDLSNTTIMIATFAGCTSFNSPITAWNVSNITDMNSLFLGCTVFNQNISSWNVANNTSLESMFNGASAFNQPIGIWNVSNVTTMLSCFENATSFNQNIGSWNVSNVTDLTDFMTGKTDTDYSAANLNAIYNTWSALTLQPNVTADFGTIKYTVAGQAGRNVLTGAPNNWIISDGGI